MCFFTHSPSTFKGEEAQSILNHDLFCAFVSSWFNKNPPTLLRERVEGEGLNTKWLSIIQNLMKSPLIPAFSPQGWKELKCILNYGCLCASVVKFLNHEEHEEHEGKKPSVIIWLKKANQPY